MYEIGFVNGTAGQVGATCKEWCLEQHYNFNNNEMVTSLWILAAALFVTIIYWSLQNAEYELQQQFMAAFGMGETQFKKALAWAPVLIMLFILMFLIYFPMRFL